MLKQREDYSYIGKFRSLFIENQTKTSVNFGRDRISWTVNEWGEKNGMFSDESPIKFWILYRYSRDFRPKNLDLLHKYQPFCFSTIDL